jgi:methyl-accepting chemotaxis protein
MSLFSKLSPTSKLTMGIGAIIVLIVVLSVISFQSMKHIHESGDKVYESYLVNSDFSVLRAHNSELNDIMLQEIISDQAEIADSTKTKIRSLKTEIKSITDSIAFRLTNYPEELVIVKEIEALQLDYDENFTGLIDLRERGKDSEAFAFTRNVQSPIEDSIEHKINALEKQHDLHAAEIMDGNNGILRLDLMILVAIGGIVIFLCVILAVWMVKMLRKITFEIKNGVTVLGTSAAEILSTVSEISTGATETATAISETTTTVEEVRQTAMVANQKARALMESSQKATDSADKGMESVQQVIESMKKIDKQMNIIAETVVKLSDQNRSIGEITSTVTDIADQSNLLAVNAAIEAAKAGDQGRGFAVVAQEIRSLADQSKKATIQIKEILNEIQKSVNLSVDVTEKGSSTVAEGIQLVTKSGDVIAVLAEHVEAAVQISVQISSSSQQQMAGMEQVVPAMENIRQASEQNVSGIRQAQGAATDLNLLGQKIQEIIEKYNL